MEKDIKQPDRGGEILAGDINCTTCGSSHPLGKHQPVGLSLETIKQFAADPKVQDAVYDPTNPFSIAWHKREDEHRREVEKWKEQSFRPLGDNHHNAALCPYCSPVREAGSFNARCEIERLRKDVEKWHSAAMKAGVIVYSDMSLGFPAKASEIEGNS